MKGCSKYLKSWRGNCVTGSVAYVWPEALSNIAAETSEEAGSRSWAVLEDGTIGRQPIPRFGPEFHSGSSLNRLLPYRWLPMGLIFSKVFKRWSINQEDDDTRLFQISKVSKAFFLRCRNGSENALFKEKPLQLSKTARAFLYLFPNVGLLLLQFATYWKSPHPHIIRWALRHSCASSLNSRLKNEGQ